MKNQKGITIVALVITIIVLLIFAGFSIAMLAGNNGLLTNPKQTQTTETNQISNEEIVTQQIQ